MRNRAFTLFEVLIALGVFAVAVTGLALALQSAVDAALNARSRMLARTMIESRLANPPLDGRREIDGRTNNGIHVLETFEQAEIRDTNNAILPSMWRLKVTAEPARGGTKEIAEILVYRP